MDKEGFRERYGIFINYKRSHTHLAGRIYDFFKYKGIDPFMDDYEMHQANDYMKRLRQTIADTPYFFCLLTEDGMEDLLSADHERSIYYQEIETALKSGCTILALREESVDYARFTRLPEAIRELGSVHSEIIPAKNEDFTHRMESFYRTIDIRKLNGVVSWREYTAMNANTLLLRRRELERLTATLENRFGADFVDSIRNGVPFDGRHIVKEINMACYAANVIFTPAQDMLDRKAYDFGTMFNIFAGLLEDPGFNLRLILTAPGSAAMKDAVRYRKLGNSSFEEHPEAVFLSSYASLRRLMEEEPYKSAVKRHRISMMVSECALPYAIFHVAYRRGWEEFNHVKVDLYALDIDSSVERPSMVIFEKDNKSGYDFFVRQFQALRRDEYRQASQRLIRRKEADWLREWEQLEKELRE